MNIGSYLFQFCFYLLLLKRPVTFLGKTVLSEKVINIFHFKSIIDRYK